VGKAPSAGEATAGSVVARAGLADRYSSGSDTPEVAVQQSLCDGGHAFEERVAFPMESPNGMAVRLLAPRGR